MLQEAEEDESFAAVSRELVHKPLAERQPRLRRYECETYHGLPVRCVVLVPNEVTGEPQQTIMICVNNRAYYVRADGTGSTDCGMSPDDIVVVGIATAGYKNNPAEFGDFSCIKTLADLPAGWVVAYRRDSDYYLLWHSGEQIFAQDRHGCIQKWGAPADSIQGFVLTDHIVRERYLTLNPE